MFGKKDKDNKQGKRLRISTVKMALAASVVALFIFMFSFTIAWGERMDMLESVSSADVFKTFDYETIDGGRVTSDQLKDAKITIFNVWGTECAPCILEMPNLEEFNHAYPEGEIQVVGVVNNAVDIEGNIDSRVIEEAKRVCEKQGVTFPSIIPNKDLYAFLKTSVPGTPTNFYVTSDGEIIYSNSGRMELEDMKATADGLLEQLDSKAA